MEKMRDPIPIPSDTKSAARREQDIAERATSRKLAPGLIAPSSNAAPIAVRAKTSPDITIHP
jgi:hypothetical protein